MGAQTCPEYRSPQYPETYGDLLDWAVRRVEDPDHRVFLRISEEGVTYAQFRNRVDQVSNLLTRVGVQKGDHVAVFLQSCLDYAYLYHALGKCGAVLCPINPFVKGEPLEYILRHSDSRYLITASALFDEKLAGIAGSLGNIRCALFTDERRDIPSAEALLLSEYTREEDEFRPRQRVTGDDIHGIWYTSGTTGVPKGAVVKQKTYLYRILFFADYFRMTKRDVLYYVLPTYHVAYACWGGPLALAAGAQIVQVPWFSASSFWGDVVRCSATVTFSTGTVIPILLKQPVTEAETVGRDKLRLWVGFPVDDPKSVRERWPNVKFMEAYGTTEVPVVSIADFDNPEFGDAGPPAVYTTLKILDPESGAELPPGKVGEIVAGHKLGPDYILKEYYKDPAKTKEVIRGGYWHSGDLGMINEKGHLKFADRLKDYLRIGGENVSSSVVEAVLRKHPSVLEAAIVGHKGALGHDEIVAHVVPKEEASIDPKDLFEFCNANMAYFMVPRYLVVRKELPKTGTMRVEKYKLRQEGISAGAADRAELGITLKR